jgi:hypothetical protein
MPDSSIKAESDRIADTLWDDFEKVKKEILERAPLKMAKMEAERSISMIKTLRGE